MMSACSARVAFIDKQNRTTRESFQEQQSKANDCGGVDFQSAPVQNTHAAKPTKTGSLKTAEEETLIPYQRYKPTDDVGV
jgi:hypothetical protein